MLERIARLHEAVEDMVNIGNSAFVFLADAGDFLMITRNNYPKVKLTIEFWDNITMKVRVQPSEQEIQILEEEELLKNLPEMNDSIIKFSDVKINQDFSVAVFPIGTLECTKIPEKVDDENGMIFNVVVHDLDKDYYYFLNPAEIVELI